MSPNQKYWFLHKLQTFHDGPKMPKSATVVVNLSKFKVNFLKAVLRLVAACASVIHFYPKLIATEIYVFEESNKKVKA